MFKKVIITFIANAIGYGVAAYVVTGFNLNTTDLAATAALIGVFTLIQLIILPIIKLVLTPIIIITFGLFNLVITGGLLYIIDKYAQNISIQGLLPLLYGTLIITVANMIFHASNRHKD